MLAKLQGLGGMAVSASTQQPTFGCLIVGIGGNNGVTMLAGLRANQLVCGGLNCTRGRHVRVPGLDLGGSGAGSDTDRFRLTHLVDRWTDETGV